MPAGRLLLTLLNISWEDRSLQQAQDWWIIVVGNLGRGRQGDGSPRGRQGDGSPYRCRQGDGSPDTRQGGKAIF